jgi:hypothetical protein
MFTLIACMLGGYALTSILSVFIPMITSVITLCSSGGVSTMQAAQSMCTQIPSFIAAFSDACEQLPGATAPGV